MTTDTNMKEEKCSNIKNHTKCPTGYIQWHAWAKKKSKTHHQIRCKECGAFTIWIKN